MSAMNLCAHSRPRDRHPGGHQAVLTDPGKRLCLATVWTCTHGHRTIPAAWQCAETERRRRVAQEREAPATRPAPLRDGYSGS